MHSFTLRLSLIAVQVVELEQWLMEGAYNKVLDARARAASEYHRHFLDQLSSTVR